MAFPLVWIEQGARSADHSGSAGREPQSRRVIAVRTTQINAAVMAKIISTRTVTSG